MNKVTFKNFYGTFFIISRCIAHVEGYDSL